MSADSIVTYKVLSTAPIVSRLAAWVLDAILAQGPPTVGNGREARKNILNILVIAPPNSGIPTAANASTGARARTIGRSTLNGLQVLGSFPNSIVVRGLPAPGQGTTSGIELRKVGASGVGGGDILDEIRIDFLEDLVNVLNRAGDIEDCSVVPGLDGPDNVLNGISRDGDLEASDLWSVTDIGIPFSTGPESLPLHRREQMMAYRDSQGGHDQGGESDHLEHSCDNVVCSGVRQPSSKTYCAIERESC